MRFKNEVLPSKDYAFTQGKIEVLPTKKFWRVMVMF
jgi:hypothetical protein